MERARLVCPACGYDVAQTIEDGFSICPECGGPADAITCSREVEQISGGARGIIYLAWFLPVVAAALAWLDPRFVWVLVATLAGVYLSWFGIERWLRPRGAWRRAIAPALAVMVLDLLALGVMVMVLSVLSLGM